MVSEEQLAGVGFERRGDLERGAKPRQLTGLQALDRGRRHIGAGRELVLGNAPLKARERERAGIRS